MHSSHHASWELTRPEDLQRMISGPEVAMKNGPLTLNQFTMADAARVQALAGDYEVSRNTTNLPHPYSLADAERWIARHRADRAAASAVNWAIRSGGGDVLVGAIGVEISLRDQVAHLGYWIGKSYWGQGFASMAAAEVVHWAKAKGIQRIAARCLAENSASMCVLCKIGLKEEGRLRGHVVRDNRRQDVLYFGAQLSEI